MIHVRDLTKHYADLRRGQFVALGGITFDAVPGQIFGLLGPNGAGKTTALRILSTVLRPTSGTATVNGCDVVTQPSQVRRQVGFISASTGMYDRMSAWEMVEYFGRLHGMETRSLAERMEQLFDRLQMNEIRDVLGAKMSTGMKQKVSIARAIVHDPPVLIFDEATSGLDVLVARALLKTVAELREQGKCIVFSTHIMREAEKLCDRIAIIHRGHILAEGTLDELRELQSQHDLEELFFQLISRHDEQHRAELALENEHHAGMKLSNVNLIFLREVRDQFRDRRTLFMIFVLPMLLYPLLAMSLTQVAQFVREHPTPIKIIGLPELEGLPALVTDGQVAKEWLGSLRPDLLPVELESTENQIQEKPIEQIESEAQTAIKSQRHQAVLYFPPSFAHNLETFRQAVVADRQRNGPDRKPPTVPEPRLFVNSADEKSKMAGERVSRAVTRWTDAIGERILASGDLPVMAAHPFELKEMDVADVERRKAAVWSKMLPFVLIIWALTGAFYPAIDLCAGEKERGTLETLLTSPAERSEIVAGKLLTVMLFSMATSALNLVSMGVTGIFMFQQFQALGEGFEVGMPPLRAGLWLLLTLIPVSALFSALCIALASFARSNKEGQYYLVPVMLVCLPLLILPMSPGVELSLGYSLIPLTGLVLLLKSLLEGDYLGALPFVPPVLIVTGLCCVLALRWAIDQFNKESVLFRESERLDLKLWLRHLVRDRQDTPSVTEAIFCAVLILVIQFFLGMSLPPPVDFAGFVRLVLVSQLVVILTPPLLMTIMLTRSPVKTLLLRLPPRLAIPMAILLAICVHPLVLLLHQGLQRLYPLPDLGQQFAWLADAPIGMVLLLVAVTPAICEELAFRGFILSGLRHLGHRWQAIVLSAVFFGITHQILQQSIIATVVGVILGYLAVQTGSIFTGMAYHVTHNAVMVLHIELFNRYPGLEKLLLRRDETSVEYHPVTIGVAAFLTFMILVYFARLSPTKSAEEALQEKIGQQDRVHLPDEDDQVAGRPTKAAV